MEQGTREGCPSISYPAIGDGTDDEDVSPSPRHPRPVRDVRASLAGALFQRRSIALASGRPAPTPTDPLSCRGAAGLRPVPPTRGLRPVPPTRGLPLPALCLYRCSASSIRLTRY
ncbi:MAG: hypothetical protein M3Y81_24390, partial [Chloroflexota bacterium]|nr:hypothetical protein [Chloroflexota bacterium]